MTASLPTRMRTRPFSTPSTMMRAACGIHLQQLLAVGPGPGLVRRRDLVTRAAGEGQRVVGDAGRDAARVDDADADRVPLEEHLGAQGLGEAAHGELRGAVVRHPGLGQVAVEARDVHHVSVAGGDQVRQEGLRPVDDTVQVHPEDSLVVGPLAVEHRSAERDAGVVEDLVDLPEVGDDLGGVRLHGVAVTHVDDGGVQLAAAPGRGLLQAGLVDVTPRDQGASLAELDGERAADAGAGPGDDDDLVADAGGAHEVAPCRR